jgi:coenzyme Q-binding protein COQ10
VPHRFAATLPYRADQLFDLAADVERYPEFLPSWRAVRIRRRDGNVYYTDQIIGFAMVRQRFRSKTVLRPPTQIDVTASDGPIRGLHLCWRFESLPGEACEVVLSVDLALHPPVVQDLFDRAIARRLGSIMSAFQARARRLYGPDAGS